MYIFWNWFFVRDVRNQNQGHVSRNCIPKKLFEQIGTGVFIFTFFNYNAWIDTAAEVYLEPFQTYMIGIFCEKN